MYPLVCPFVSLEKNILNGQGPIMSPGVYLIGKIYVELYMALLHIKYASLVSCGCKEEDVFMFSIISLW